MPTSFVPLEVEHFPDGDATLGWLVRYAEGLAIWCGELSFAAFSRQPSSVRLGLRDDLGWYLIEVDTRVAAASTTRVLARIAREADAVELATVVALGRKAQLTRAGGAAP